ncbi:MAG TPA: UbiA family prenyltransferase [Cyclobacteriaceae bacterium]
MFSRSTLLHLRIPFSLLLMPVYVFALGLSPNLNESRLLWSFLIIHLLLYPASNAYNSYFDKDEGSIGLLKNPPPVKKELYGTALLFDGIAIMLGFIIINIPFAVLLFIYGLASKAYSHPSIRLKKYPITGWIIAGFFQGFFTFMMCYIGINEFGFENISREPIWIAASLTSLMLWASYPMTQVYQHDEDKKHGDKTMSRLLGIRGTFFFAIFFFVLSTTAFVFYFSIYSEMRYAYGFVLLLVPVVLFFLYWFSRVWKDETRANYNNTMWLNFISALCLNGFFIWFFLETSHVLQR